MNNNHYSRLLDVGFGSGIFLPALAIKTDELYAIDLHPEVSIVKNILDAKKIKANLMTADVCHLAYPDNYFDAVVCLSVLEFIKDRKLAIDEIYRVAKPGADIIIGAPVLNHLTTFLYERVIKFNNHKQVHCSNQQEIINTVKNKFTIDQIVTLPKLPLKYSLFFLLRAKKSTS